MGEEIVLELSVGGMVDTFIFFTAMLITTTTVLWMLWNIVEKDKEYIKKNGSGNKADKANHG